jgi:hypothetical protein
MEDGLRAIPTAGTSITAALAVFVESATLVAVIVTVCWELIVDGA